ncbi:antiviral helicase [Choiromyces venosus 120613-1]|uniref:Antiviral helicase n=1 Tax=Choiromyces venosus 120613-1 TaxID=1336337 RepID=A0A3N4JN35_9PEZI|nr:antiviral helicase [Choiromyces venosus 120613-1]
MTSSEDLVDAINQLSLVNFDKPDGWIDDILNKRLPRKRVKPDPSELREQLQQEFLTPSPEFSNEWLNKLQKRWDDPPDYTSLMGLAPSMSRTVIRFTREGLEGRVTGYKEVTVPAHSITAKNSTSLLRKPASKADFVRGKAGFFPFRPGGVDIGAANERPEELELQEALMEEKIGKDGLLRVAPGMSRGLMFEEAPGDNEVSKEVDDDGFKFGDVEPKRRPKGGTDDNARKKAKEPLAELDTIDDLLPVEFPMLAPKGNLPSVLKPKTREWAHMVNMNQEITNFRELVPNMAKEWPFELDGFQKEAVFHLENGDSVFVAAHTSAGKTVVAEYAIALATKHMTKAIYTSPIKALSNQKFRDFRHVFEDVGILTGDVQINPEASCLIMTTEILRSMLYRGADLIRDVEFVIFDEVHYVNDSERGVVWEEVIIMLPEHVNLILLSATVPNPYEFASWVGRTKKKDIYVISTPKRPVPLEHYIWANKAMYKIVNSEKKFLEEGLKDANNALKKKEPDRPQQGGGGQRGGGQNQRGGRGGPQRGGRGGVQRGGQSTAGFSRSGRGGMRTTTAQDKNIWVHLVHHLKKETLLPAVIFVFSKKRCEENADALSAVDFSNQTEKSAIHMIIEKSVARLKPEDRLLPQILRMRELLARGLAVHHGGLLPIVKEIVEILFAKSLVKVLFATETFAMGLNLPTRTVVFSGYRKHDGKSFRDLQPGEYIQMAGRAGRRGLDERGIVIIVSPMDEAPPAATLKQMLLGQPTKLQSQFRLTYNMILNLLRVEALKIEEMIKRSFSENSTQTLLPKHEQQVQESQEKLKLLQSENCETCNSDLSLFVLAAEQLKKFSREVIKGGSMTTTGRKYFTKGRLVAIGRKDAHRTIGFLAAEGTSGGPQPVVQVLALVSRDAVKPLVDNLPFIIACSKGLTSPPYKEWKLRLQTVRISDIEFLGSMVTRLNIARAHQGSREDVQAIEEELRALYGRWTHAEWTEVDWSRIKDLTTLEHLEHRKSKEKEIDQFQCLECNDFATHFALGYKKYLLELEVANLKHLISDQNLQLLPDYEQRVLVLKDLDFIDENMNVQLKGRVACEINSANELVLTELILENVFAEYEPEEIVALLSAFVFSEKTDVVPTITARLEKGKAKIIEISKRVNQVQIDRQIIMSPENDDFENRPRFGLMEVVYEWAKGMSFSQITDLTDVLEGTIVRAITRLDEACREVKNSARIIGDPSLFVKMQECQELIKRDVCHCASLYL